MAVSSAAGAAQAATQAGAQPLIQPLPKSNFSGPGAGIYLQKQNEAELAYQQAMAELMQKKNTAYHEYGLNAQGAVDPYSQFGRYQSLLSRHESDLSAASENAQQRGLGTAGLGMQGERALRYQQGAEDLALQQDITGIASGYASGSQAALLARNQAMLDAQLQALAIASSSPGGTGVAPTHPAANPPTPPGATAPPGTNPPGGPSGGQSGNLPTAPPSSGGGALIWDVNSPSTFWGINAAQNGGGTVVLTPDADPETDKKFKAAAEAGVPVSIAINADANDTPASLAAKIADAKKKYPGASFTLDLESPQFRGGKDSANWNNMTAFAQAALAAAGGTPLTVTTEGVSDFNYGAWNSAGTTFSPQAYWGDMSARDVQSIVDMLVAQGIDPASILPLIGPGQDLGGYTGRYGIYGIPTGGPTTVNTANQAPVKPLTQGQQNQLVNTSGIADPSKAIQQAYAQALIAPTSPLQELATRIIRSRAGME
jgi:hypothetical protein